MTASTALSVVSVLFAGSMAGLLFGWMVSVIPGLLKVNDTTYVSTMQSINVQIINPMFVIPFVGTPLVLVVAAIVQLRAGEQRRAWLLFGSAATYVAGVLMVTGVGNVPLNDHLDALDLEGVSSAVLARERSGYEAPWNRWHFVRTVASGLAFTLATSSLVITETE